MRDEWKRAASREDRFEAWQRSVARLGELEQRLESARIHNPREVARLLDEVRVLRAATSELLAVLHAPRSAGAGSA